jgi:hypothetical protein
MVVTGEAYNMCSQCAHIIALRSTEDPQCQAQYWYKMNCFIFNEDIPARSRPLPSESMIKDLTVSDCDIVADCPAGSIEITARVLFIVKTTMVMQ